MTSPPVAEAATEVRGLIHHRVRPNRAGSGNFHPLAQKAKRKLAIEGTPMPKALISERLWELDRRGALARAELSEDGFTRSMDPTAWDALLVIIRNESDPQRYQR